MAKYIVMHSIKVATDFVPETFGRLTTIGPRFRASSTSGRRYYQVCQCECGVVATYDISAVRYGKIKSCGCLQRESRHTNHQTHGECRKTPEYASWKRMKGRCCDPNNNRYYQYGGRGITICQEWLGSDGYANFLSYMGRKSNPAQTIDRYPDPNGNYEPGNCRWADIGQQMRNRTNNRMITAFGRTQTLIQWSEDTGIAWSTIWARLNRGWTAEKALTESVGRNTCR